MNICPTQDQASTEPDYIIMKPVCPKESPKVEIEIENCFKCGHTYCMFGLHGQNLYEHEFTRVSSSLAASSKALYPPGTKEALQYNDERQNKNHGIFSYKFRHCVAIAFIFIFIIMGKLRIK
jgi:hypothetical protein